MGNEFEIDLKKYNCSCMQSEDNCFIDFVKDIRQKDPFDFNIAHEKLSQSELQENTPGGIHYPNDNMVKSTLKKYVNKKIIKKKYINYTEQEESSETNVNGKNSINNLNLIIDRDEDDNKQRERDIQEFDKKTNYFLLANQISNAINELKVNLFSNDENLIINSKTPECESSYIDNNENLNFEKAIKRAGKRADKIIFTDIINCIKKISDIHSEVNLINERVYLGIVNKFRKEKNGKYLINYNDREKIIDIPNFEDIKEKNRLQLGEKFNNPKFKFNKFTIKGSFPNEILIWNLISQNTQKIADIITENYYCCIVLLYYSKVEEENETIMYLVNKPNI
jgi:hypothetical protein